MTALRTYLTAERGRATRLADRLDVSPGYVSELAAGKKLPSPQLAARIARETGLPVADLLGIGGFGEAAVEALDPGRAANRLHDMAGTVAPRLRHRSYYRTLQPNAALGVLAGDILIVEANFDPDQILPGETVVASLQDESGEARTVIARAAAPWLLGSDGSILAQLGNTAAVAGLVRGLLRGSGLDVFLSPSGSAA